jgi:hypothetical protein
MQHLQDAGVLQDGAAAQQAQARSSTTSEVQCSSFTEMHLQDAGVLQDGAAVQQKQYNL